ncbi:hypothetical protein BDQ17DRAFT_1328936 [Cyathus striatus]|nr:hypothetical protein BDQ17DRAFT_1328936 [Cyathus striatus]
MNVTNPYAQGGWGNPGNPGTIAGQFPNHSSIPPTFGALPAISAEPSPTLMAFFFVSSNYDILNSSVIGTKSQKYFDIQSTPYGGTEFTNFRRPSGETFSVVEWNGRPKVELQNLFRKDYVSRWMPLSSDRSSRTVTIGSTRYTWIYANEMVYVYPYGGDTRSLVARIYRGKEAITLEMTVNSLQAGLLEPFVVTAALLFSGRAIE